ncbi:MAG TPA: AtpZ/AtpI family protein [Gemmatimonadaceae bacterium]
MTEPNNRPPTERELDKLLFRRKGMSGSEFAGIGMQFAAVTVGFALAGVWLDKRLGTSPWLVIVGVFSGASLGLWQMVRQVTRAGRKRK